MQQQHEMVSTVPMLRWVMRIIQGSKGALTIRDSNTKPATHKTSSALIICMCMLIIRLADHKCNDVETSYSLELKSEAKLQADHMHTDRIVSMPCLQCCARRLSG